MKKFVLYSCLFFLANNAIGQYYLRGEIKDDHGHPIQNAKIFLHSARNFYYSGTTGGFGITVNNQYDSLTVSLDGYETKVIRVRTDQWQVIILKLSESTVSRNRPKLISVTRDQNQGTKFSTVADNETYFQLVENSFVNTYGYPNTGFSLNVNKASYSNVRRFLNTESKVPPDAVRIEELINYFNLHYQEPVNDEVFRMGSQLTSCPWDAKKQLLFLNISAKKLNLEKVPPGNFVFLIDVSGSMDMPNRLPLVKAAFQMFVKTLRAKDTVSIVTYGGTVGVWLMPTSGAEKEKIIESIESLTAAGDTPGESAIRFAYKLAQSTFIKGGNNRVILATDGDFNVGEHSEKSLDELITNQRKTGIYLTCLGVGMGNFKDSKLQILAKKGNGNYAYLDDIMEAEKVLVKELTQTLFAVADDVIMNVNFNPAYVKQYRMIGFDNRRDAAADIESDMEGSEIGGGNNTMAVFEIIPAYQNRQSKNTDITDDIATLSLKYSHCNDTSTLISIHKVKNNYMDFDSLDKDLRFVTAVAMFGLKLKQSQYFNDADWSFIRNIAVAAAEKENYLQQEFLRLIDKADKLYTIKKKKKIKLL